MPIIRDHDPRVGCLALPISVLAGFIVGALFAAAVGASATTSGIVGLVMAVVGAVVAQRLLRGRGVLGGEPATGAARNGPDNTYDKHE